MIQCCMTVILRSLVWQINISLLVLFPTALSSWCPSGSVIHHFSARFVDSNQRTAPILVWKGRSDTGRREPDEGVLSGGQQHKISGMTFVDLGLSIFVLVKIRVNPSPSVSTFKNLKGQFTVAIFVFKKVNPSMDKAIRNCLFFRHGMDECETVGQTHIQSLDGSN